MGLFALACFFSPFRLFRLQFPVSLSWSDACLFAAAAVAVVQSFRARESLRIPFLFGLVCFLMLISIILTSASNTDFYNFRMGLTFFISLAGVPVIALWVTQGRRERVILAMIALLMGNFLLAIIAICNDYGYQVLTFLGDTATRVGRQSGPTVHPTLFAHNLVVVLPFAMYFILKSQFVIQAAALCIAGLMLMAIDISGSRSAVLAVLVAIVPMLVMMSGAIKAASIKLFSWFVVVWVPIWIVLFIIEIGPQDVLESSAFDRLVFSAGTADRSSFARANIIQLSWQEFLEKPLLGVGYKHLWQAHSGYLSVLHTSGMIGGFAYFLWLLFCLFGFASWHRGNHLNGAAWADRLLWAAVFSSFLAWVVNLLFQSFVEERSGYYSIGLMLSIVAGAASVRKHQQSAEYSTSHDSAVQVSSGPR